MKEKNIKIFLYDLSILFNNFAINDTTLELLRNFMMDTYYEETEYYINLVFDVENINEEESNVSFDGYKFFTYYNQIQKEKNLRKIFDGVDAKTIEDIGLLASSCAVYIDELLCFMYEDSHKLLLQ